MAWPEEPPYVAASGVHPRLQALGSDCPCGSESNGIDTESGLTHISRAAIMSYVNIVSLHC